MACLVVGLVLGQGGNDGEMYRVSSGAVFRTNESEPRLVRQVQRETNNPYFGADAETTALDEPTPALLPDVLQLTPPPPAEALPVVSRQLPSSIEAIIAARFNESPYGADYWIAVARCESSLRPSAIGHGETYIGLFQVWLNHGYGYAWLLDPYNNTLAAWELSREGTVTSPWPYCGFAISW